MNTKKYIFLALTALLAAACHDSGSWDEPSTQAGMEAYGNQHLKATNLKTIAEVKAIYSNVISGGSLEQITEPLQIQGVVVGNDEGGNIYQALYLQDASGAISISISQAGLYGPFAIGQAVLVELNGLYIGGYGQQPQIGTTYTNPKNGNVQTGRMSRYEWQKHYKLIEPIAGLTATPLEVTNLNGFTVEKDACKLITLKGVELSAANGKKVFANSSDAATNQTAVNRNIKGMSNVVLRTSTFADFANAVMPMGKQDITGIASYYNGTWQILMRTEKDITPAQ